MHSNSTGISNRSGRSSNNKNNSRNNSNNNSSIKTGMTFLLSLAAHQHLHCPGAPQRDQPAWLRREQRLPGPAAVRRGRLRHRQVGRHPAGPALLRRQRIQDRVAGLQEHQRVGQEEERSAGEGAEKVDINFLSSGCQTYCTAIF